MSYAKLTDGQLSALALSKRGAGGDRRAYAKAQIATLKCAKKDFGIGETTKVSFENDPAVAGYGVIKRSADKAVFNLDYNGKWNGQMTANPYGLRVAPAAFGFRAPAAVAPKWLQVSAAQVQQMLRESLEGGDFDGPVTAVAAPAGAGTNTFLFNTNGQALVRFNAVDADAIVAMG